MILLTGSLTPTKAQLNMARAKADDTFCTIVDAEFMSNFPSFEGFVVASAPILLKLKNVEPHNDPWVGNGAEPGVRRAIFWLLEGGGQSAFSLPLVFGCGRKYHKMKPGDFVVFNDVVDHWVMSEKLWRGAAAQLTKVK
jgi:hypothetical protein